MKFSLSKKKDFFGLSDYFFSKCHYCGRFDFICDYGDDNFDDD